MTAVDVEAPAGTFDRFAGWLATASPWRVLVIAAVVRAVVCGVWTTPNLEQWVIFARDPFGPAPIDPAAQFITGSPLGPLLAHTLGATTTATYAALHLALAAVSAVVLVALGRHTVGDRLTNALVVLLVASPLSNVVLTWLGQPDAAMLGALSALGLASAVRTPSRARAVALAAGAVLGFSSFEQGLAAVVVLAALVWVGDREGDREVVLAAVGGLVAGRIGVAAFHAASDVPVMSRSTWARSLGPGVFVRTFLYNLPALAFSLLGAGWLLAGHAGAALHRRGMHLVHLLVPPALALGVALVALDQTRGATMVVWPAAVWAVRRGDEAREGGLDRRIVAATALLAVVIPPVVIWEGSPYISSWLEIRNGR